MVGALIKLGTRIVRHPKTTLGGMFMGGGLAAAGYMVMQDAGCDFDKVNWEIIVGMLAAGPIVQGAASTDNGKGV